MREQATRRALILQQQGRYADAEREWRAVLGQDPHDAEAHAMLGLCLLERLALTDATAEAEQSVHLAPDLPLGHYALGHAMLKRNRFADAAAAAAEAIRLDAHRPDHFALLAAVRFAQRDWSAALAAADQGLAVDPDHDGCLNLRAMALTQLGRRAEAGRTIAGALEKDPENATTHANEGWRHLHRNDHRRALEHFREALRLDPTHDWAKAGLVEALKARYLVYRVMLRYFLWIGRLSGRAQWGVVIGFFLAQRLLRGAAAANPDLRPVVWPILIAYGAFVFMTWLAYPLSNLLLRLNRYGRYALTDDQRRMATWVGVCLLAAGVCATVSVAGGVGKLLMPSLGLVLLAFPITALYVADVGWPRTVMVVTTAVLAALLIAGTAMVLAAPAKDAPLQKAGNMTLLLFFVAAFVSQLLGNAMAGATAKR